jgi:hypothetical protein
VRRPRFFKNCRATEKKKKENLRGVDHLAHEGVDGKMILTYILKKRGACGLGSSGSQNRNQRVPCEHGNELSGSTNGGEFFTS